MHTLIPGKVFYGWFGICYCVVAFLLHVPCSTGDKPFEYTEDAFITQTPQLQKKNQISYLELSKLKKVVFNVFKN
jgi:hypothetical protein